MTDTEQNRIKEINNKLQRGLALTVKESRDLYQYIKELEQESKWIPVSELPKENGWYQCTVIFYDSLQAMELFYKNGKWLDNRRIDMFNTYDIYGYGNTKEKHKLSYQELFSEFDWTENVTAWKLLSGPYISDTDDGKITESEVEE